MEQLTPESVAALKLALEIHLDTRDKRYMFLRMEFKEILPMINIEGAPRHVAFEIYQTFKSQGMIGSLMACLNCKLDCNLYLETE